MTDPNEGLVSFSAALDEGEIDLHKCPTVPNLWLHRDEPAPGIHRFTYALIVDGELRGISMIVAAEPVGRVPCFGIGYAVPEDLRGRGYGKLVAAGAIKEFRDGMANAGVKRLFIEAIVGIENMPSRAIAASVISEDFKETHDSVSGQPAVQFISDGVQ